MQGTARPSVRVLSTPTLSPLSLAMSWRAGRLQEPLDSSRARLYHRGRYAIWHALKALGIGSGDNVAFPAFHCGTELEPFLDLGIEVRYYRTTPSLQVNLDSLSSLIDKRTRAAFIIHYFGLPQDVVAIHGFCRERGIGLIEDCAHALGGKHQDRYLGTFGDAAVFSIRKFVPIPDGGALLLNRPEIPLPEAPTAPPLRANLGELKSKLARNLALNLQRSRWGRAVKASVIRPVSAALKDGRAGSGAEARAWGDLYQFRKEEIDWGMSPLSQAVWRNTNVALVASRRRANFQLLLDQLRPSRRVRPLVHELPAGACPWVFPVLVEEVDPFIEFLLARGIAMRRFWEYMRPEFPKAKFPEETSLREHILTLPVHQEVDAAALGIIVEVVNRWAAGA